MATSSSPESPRRGQIAKKLLETLKNGHRHLFAMNKHIEEARQLAQEIMVSDAEPSPAAVKSKSEPPGAGR